MSDTILVPVQTASVPANFCFEGFNSSSWLELVNLMFVRIQAGNGYMTKGTTTPGATERDFPWLRLEADLTPDRIYVYLGGDWISPHPVPPPAIAGTGMVQLWEGSEANIEFIDGNTDAPGTAVTDRTGAFWEKVTGMEGRVPIGVGSLDLGDLGSINLAVGGTDGRFEHKLAIEEMPPHQHSPAAGAGTVYYPDLATGTSVGFTFNSSSPTKFMLDTDYQWAGGDDTQTNRPVVAHTNVQPVKAFYMVRRTQRKFYVAP